MPKVSWAAYGTATLFLHHTTGKKAATGFKKMANKAGLTVESGGKYFWVKDATGNAITKIPHSPANKATIKAIADDILNAASL